MSGSSSPCSRVYARRRSRASTICWRSSAARLAEPRHPVDHVHDEVEAVEVVEHHHVERRRRGALLLVAAHVQVARGWSAGRSAGGSATGSRGRRRSTGLSVVNSASNSRSGRPCGCSVSGCSRIRSTTLTTRTLSSGRSLAQEVGRGQRLERRDVAGARQHDVGLAVVVGATPSPRCPRPRVQCAIASSMRQVRRAPAACRPRSR